MKLKLRIGLGLLVVALCGAAFALRSARADDGINAKLLALFPQFDANRDAVLSPAEQERAVAAVRKQYGEYWARQVKALFKLAAAEGAVSQARWQEQATGYGQVHTQTVRIAMRDGVHLATDVYLPTGPGPFPVVLSRTPYNRQQQAGAAQSFVRAGQVFVAQDMRGRFASEGENIPFVGCGWGEHQDGVDTLAWLRQQPWCNGQIGTLGASAGGITQNLLAGAAPAGLRAQYIIVAAASLFHDTAYIGGAFRKADVENWTTQNKFDARALQLMHTHLTYDDYWRTFDTSLKFSSMNVPAVHQGGWFDMFAQATLNEFVGRQHEGGAGSRGQQKLVMGPWAHGGAKKEGVGELHFRDNRMPEAYSSGPWFEHYLGGESNGVEQLPAVAYYVMGDASSAQAPGNEWRYARDWPVPALATPFYFAPRGQLTAGQPAAGVPVEYTFDPANPCPTVGGNNLTLASGPMNQNKIEQRGDVVLFTSAPLEAPLEVTGRVMARLFVESSAVDTDLSVRLCDVYPDGKSYLIAEGMARARYRKSLEKTEPLTPGKVEEVTVDCWSTSIVFNKGHRIRATVTSSNYPRFDLNPGTGQPWSETGAKVKQTNRIHCEGAHASCLILPVVAPKLASAGR